MLKIGWVDPSNANSGSKPVQVASASKMDPVFTERLVSAHEADDASADEKQVDNYIKFKSLIKGSPIGNKFLTKADAAHSGFKPAPGLELKRGADGKLISVPDPNSQLMDDNGGLHYINEKTGEALRICEFERSLEYTKGNTTQTQWFDENGKPAGGIVTVKDPKTGEITEYRYENDIDGNQFITSVKVKSGKPADSGKKDDKIALQEAFKETVLTDKFLSPKALEAKGWKKESYMDMNGGQYYTDPKTGATVRVMPSRLLGEGKSMSVRTENMAHFAKYDDNGQETGGVVQIKQDDGTIKVYDYGVDVDGNKFIKSVKTSEHDYFAEYE